MTFYKVVSRHNETPFSSVSDGVLSSSFIKAGKLLTTYVPNKWTVKKKYGPFVFSTRGSAWDFIKGVFQYSLLQNEIWECEVENARLLNWVIKPTIVSTRSPDTICRKMNKLSPYQNDDDWDALPLYTTSGFTSFVARALSHTYVTSRIKLTRRIA